MKNPFRLPTLFVVSETLLLALALTALLATTTFAQEPPARRAVGNNLVTRLEAKLGKSLSAEQREQIGDASKQSVEKLKALQGTFVTNIASAVKLPTTDIEPMMPKIGEPNPGFDKNMIPKLETKLARKLTADELAAIRKADTAKKSAMKPVQDNYAAQLAKITGLSVEVIRPMLPKIGL